DAPVGGNDRSVAVQTRAGLLALGHAFGDFLVIEHVRVAAALAVIEAESVSGVEAAEPGMRFEFALRHRARPAVARLRDIHGAAVGVELVGPVLPPWHGIRADLVHFGNADE